MPRVDPRLIRKAGSIHPHLARILPICRDLHSAHRELRWMRDHANSVYQDSSPEARSRGLQEYVARRARGEPLQYILGTEFFGDLEIECRPGVLIPRPETAASVIHLVNLLSLNQRLLPHRLRLLDLCTGTGCIPLLFHHEFQRSILKRNAMNLDMIGVDISSSALEVAEANRTRYLNRLAINHHNQGSRKRSLQNATFLRADVLADMTSSETRQIPPLLQALRQHEQSQHPTYDILISNPPYISPADYWRTTSPSVRRYEPLSALVPPDSDKVTNNIADIFYQKMLDIALQINAQVVLFEGSDLQQAKRVASAAVHQEIWTGVEIWRDDPASKFSPSTAVEVEGEYKRNSTPIPILGAGNGRSVLIYRGFGTEWLGKAG